MPGRVDQYADMLLGLVIGNLRSERNGVGYGRIEVSDLEIEMHHGALPSLNGRPHGWHVALSLLEDEIDRPLGRSDDGGVQLSMNNRPIKQLRIELSKSARIGRLNRHTPPHVLRARAHELNTNCTWPTFVIAWVRRGCTAA
jgi:hypothetical protein